MRVLLIDFNADSAALLSHSIKRKFPQAVVDYTGEAKEALASIAAKRYTAIVVHRTYEQDAVALVTTARKLDPDVLIIACSGVDKSEDVLSAGADGFLHYDEWLRIGTVIATALEHRDSTASK